MRYVVNTDYLANRLIPYLYGGRKIVLFVQSLLKPLNTLNLSFVSFAKEKHIEARMTSQVMYFEWFLNRRLSKYFINQNDRIFIIDNSSLGVPIFHENALNGIPFTIWFNGEAITAVVDSEKPKALYTKTEEYLLSNASFIVAAPDVTISQKEFVYMLSNLVNKYRIAGKTFLIKINGVEVNNNTI